jgi:two-component system LytT family response regulator
MKVILIDDERPALLQLETLLQETPDIEITGKFLSAQEGLDYLAHEQVDIVFLDIGMPEMNGLTAAEYIQQIDINIRIVFITAYAEYAIEAFELHALDYLLKPVDPIRFSKTLNRIKAYFPTGERITENLSNPELEVICFKRLALSAIIDPEGKMKWRTAKIKELFAFLIHHKRKWVARDLLIEAIWPQFTPDKAMIHLHTSIYQIRKIIKLSGLQATLEFSLESYRLNADNLTTDVELFESRLNDMESLKIMNESQWRQSDFLLKLYKGHYFEEEDYTWAKSKRMQLLQQYMKLTLHTAEYELENGHERQAIRRLVEAYEKEPYSEELALLMMSGLGKLQDYKSLKRFYESFVRLLRNELDIEPQPETLEHYEHLMLSGR